MDDGDARAPGLWGERDLERTGVWWEIVRAGTASGDDQALGRLDLEVAPLDGAILDELPRIDEVDPRESVKRPLGRGSRIARSPIQVISASGLVK